MYGGIEVVSFRDEPWEEAENLIKDHYNQGYTTIIIDDAFMMTKGDYEDEGVFHPEDEEEVLKIAWHNWWSIE